MRRQASTSTVLSLLLSALAFGCATELLGTGRDNTPEENFDALWEEFDHLYAFFDLKEIDWDAVRDEYRPQLRPDMSEAELAGIFDEILAQFDDGHIFLQTADSVYYSDKERRAVPSTFDADIVETYLASTGQTVGDGKIRYGRLAPDVGYIRVSSWTDRGGSLSAVGDWVHDFDSALDDLWDVEGLVIDVRGNSGGSYFNGRFVAGRLAAEPYVATHSQFRNGPAHDDFTELDAWSVEPRGPTFERPVALLTDRQTASASEWFTLALRELPQVILVGSPTAGALGTRIRRELPNGWIYGLPVQRLYSADLELLEKEGIAPDVPVAPPPAGAAADPALDRAIEILRATT